MTGRGLEPQADPLPSGVGLSSQPELAKAYRDGCSAEGVLKLVAEAVAMGERIPGEAGAAKAATGLRRCKVRHIRGASEAAGAAGPVPPWLAGG